MTQTDAVLALGLADAPTEQKQRPVCFLPDVDGHIGIYGTGGSGKSVALRTLAIAAGSTRAGGPVAVYGLDFAAGSLRMLEPLPHVGSIIGGDDTERIIRLFRLLKAELESRGNRFAEATASTIAEYRALANRPNEPRILLLIDGFAAFREDWEVASGRSNWYDVFRSILSDGRQLGIHVAFTADRSGSVPSSVRSSVQRRVVLRLADDTGYNLLDVPGDILNAKSAPGRAIFDDLETQIAVWGGSAVAAEQAAAVRVLAASLRAEGIQAALPIGSLSRDYPATELPDRVKSQPTLGLSDETLAPVGFEPRGTLLLSGPPASGRSTALRALMHAFERFDPTVARYYIGNARSGLAGLPGWVSTATTIVEAVELAKELTKAVSADLATPRMAIVVENLADFLQTPADAALVELIKQVKRSDHFLVADGETASWNSSWPLFAEMKNTRRGLLLQPDTIEGDILLKTPLPRLNRAEFPPGRGMMVASGKVVRVQLPLVE